MSDSRKGPLHEGRNGPHPKNADGTSARPKSRSKKKADIEDGFYWELEDGCWKKLPLPLPRIVIADLPEGYKDAYPFKDGEAVLLLAEIQNMQGHYAVATRDGRVLWGFHPETFRVPTEDEI